MMENFIFGMKAQKGGKKLMTKELKRTPLVMMPNGNFLRGDEFVKEGVVVDEPPLYEKPPTVIDQTEAVKGQNE